MNNIGVPYMPIESFDVNEFEKGFTETGPEESDEINNDVFSKEYTKGWDRSMPLILSGMGMEKYIELFRKENIRVGTFMQLNNDDLLNIGITDRKDREIILKNLSDYKPNKKKKKNNIPKNNKIIKNLSDRQQEHVYQKQINDDQKQEEVHQKQINDDQKQEDVHQKQINDDQKQEDVHQKQINDDQKQVDIYIIPDDLTDDLKIIAYVCNHVLVMQKNYAYLELQMRKYEYTDYILSDNDFASTYLKTYVESALIQCQIMRDTIYDKKNADALINKILKMNNLILSKHIEEKLNKVQPESKGKFPILKAVVIISVPVIILLIGKNFINKS